MTQKVPQKFLAYDLGGTKVAVGVVTSKGKVLEEHREPVVIQQGKTAVIAQLAALGKRLLEEHPEIRAVGMASAGPLDPATGELLDPTNFASPKGHWGRTPIARLLGAKLRRKVHLENDAAAAILAEHWVGAAKGCDNAMILTLGTGLGTGIISNGELLRAGRGLHPEAGHLILREGDASAPCGCGNLGCAEAYLSGRNFSRRARVAFGKSDLSAKDLAELARKRDPRAVAAFDEYALLMATAIHNYAVIYAPELVVFTGSFAAASDLFLKATREHLKKMLARRRVGVDLLPKLVVSKLDNQAGLIGGAFVALRASK
ncbi:MAG: ROK family protein [Oligoflexia bacterium]|nr:ROK family protein [Oligoflexia bacterium]